MGPHKEKVEFSDRFPPSDFFRDGKTVFLNRQDLLYGDVPYFLRAQYPQFEQVLRNVSQVKGVSAIAVARLDIRAHSGIDVSVVMEGERNWQGEQSFQHAQMVLKNGNIAQSLGFKDVGYLKKIDPVYLGNNEFSVAEQGIRNRVQANRYLTLLGIAHFLNE